MYSLVHEVHKKVNVLILIVPKKSWFAWTNFSQDSTDALFDEQQQHSSEQCVGKQDIGLADALMLFARHPAHLANPNPSTPASVPKKSAAQQNRDILGYPWHLGGGVLVTQALGALHNMIIVARVVKSLWRNVLFIGLHKFTTTSSYVQKYISRSLVHG